MPAKNLPWRFDAENGWILDCADRIVAFCAAARTLNDKPGALDDFQFICDACNSHGALVDALKAARIEISRGGHVDRWKTVKIITDALALVIKDRGRTP
jgi:hypothetical protein